MSMSSEYYFVFGDDSTTASRNGFFSGISLEPVRQAVSCRSLSTESDPEVDATRVVREDGHVLPSPLAELASSGSTRPVPSCMLQMHRSPPVVRRPRRAMQMVPVGYIVITLAFLAVTFSVAKACVDTVVFPAFLQAFGALVFTMTGMIAVRAGRTGERNVIVATLLMAIISTIVGFCVIVYTFDAVSGDDVVCDPYLPRDDVDVPPHSPDAAMNSHNDTRGFLSSPPVALECEQTRAIEHVTPIFTAVLVLVGFCNIFLVLVISCCSCSQLCAPMAHPSDMYAVPSYLSHGSETTSPGDPYDVDDYLCSMIDPPPDYSTVQGLDKETPFPLAGSCYHQTQFI